jgi:hypothetical protein
LSKIGEFFSGRIWLSCFEVRDKNFLFFSFFSVKRLRYFADSALIKRKYLNARDARDAKAF